MLVSFSSDICLCYPSWIKFFWQTSLSWMTTTTHVYMLGPSQEIQVIACLDINSIFGIRRIGSFQLLMFTVENYHTFYNALTAGTLQIAYGYPLVIIWLLAHVFISLLPFPLLNINFSIELNKWFLKLFSFFRAFWSYLIDYMMKPADSSSGAVLVPCLCANYSVWQISLWDHIIPDKEHANLQLEVKSKYPLIDQVKFSPFLHLGWLLHCNCVLTAEFFLTIIG